MKNFTTKMILSVAVIFASLTAVTAQSYDNTGYEQPAQSAYQDQYQQQNQPAQQYTQQSQYPQSNQYNTQQQGYYYYPDANVYYDPACNHYIYNDGASWLTVNVLPFNIRLGGLPRIIVYHRGPQVWLDNGFHRQNYYGYNYRFHPVVTYRNDFRRDVVYNRGFDNHGGFDRGRGFGGDRGFSSRGGFDHGRR
jgi:hypothetical protein